jgi:4-hydroxy-3-methylbut-2-enyl diphosphate reductase
MPRLIEIDPHSGFCFGVIKAIEKAEENVTKGPLYSLGDIVHNNQEVKRLEDKGLTPLPADGLSGISKSRVLFRAHGEPPSSYKIAKEKGLEIIDATCPVVLKLQQRVKNAWLSLKPLDGQIVIFGKKGHAEVIGLLGQVNNEAIVVENPDNLEDIDFTKPIELFSQTTKSIEGLQKLITNIEQRMAPGVNFQHHDTICRQVANRVPRIREFAAKHDVVIFVGGEKSSNAKVLFEVCKRSNPLSYFISKPEDIDFKWVTPSTASVGICGATSTPMWQLKLVASIIGELPDN